MQFGTCGDFPIPGDYNGDGKITLHRLLCGVHLMVIGRSRDPDMFTRGGSCQGNYLLSAELRVPIPVPMDHFNEGKLRIAVWRPSNGNCYMKGEGNSSWSEND